MEKVISDVVCECCNGKGIKKVEVTPAIIIPVTKEGMTGQIPIIISHKDNVRMEKRGIALARFLFSESCSGFCDELRNELNKLHNSKYNLNRR